MADICLLQTITKRLNLVTKSLNNSTLDVGKTNWSSSTRHAREFARPRLRTALISGFETRPCQLLKIGLQQSVELANGELAGG